MKRKSTKRATHKRRKVIKVSALAKIVEDQAKVVSRQAKQIEAIEHNMGKISSTLQAVFKAVGEAHVKTIAVDKVVTDTRLRLATVIDQVGLLTAAKKGRRR